MYVFLLVFASEEEFYTPSPILSHKLGCELGLTTESSTRQGHRHPLGPLWHHLGYWCKTGAGPGLLEGPSRLMTLGRPDPAV